MKMNIDGAVMTPVISKALRDLQTDCGTPYMDSIDDAIDLILAFSSDSSENITSEAVLHTIQNLRFVAKHIEMLMGNDVFFKQPKTESDEQKED